MVFRSQAVGRTPNGKKIAADMAAGSQGRAGAHWVCIGDSRFLHLMGDAGWWFHKIFAARARFDVFAAL